MIRKRITVVEYEPCAGFVQSASDMSGSAPAAIRDAIAVHSSRVGRTLGVPPPIRLDDDTLVAADIAGVIRLLPNLELEIAPKFLGASWGNWREDFLLVANIARSGQLLSREGIASSPGARDDLASLVAHTLLGLFESANRRPLRTYRPEVVQDWAIDGDFEAEDLLRPDSDGFVMRRMTLGNVNRFNAEMRLAATTLAGEVRDGVQQQQLRRMAFRLGRQGRIPRRPQSRVPSRHAEWQPAYDLARQVNGGLGVRLAPGPYSSPGYVLSTWLAFEQLLLTAMRIGVGNGAVTYHPTATLGTRGGGRTVSVEPDYLLRRADGDTVLVDAKYKGRAERVTSITAADLYESLAFLEATGREKVILVYPRPMNEDTPLPTGTVSEFDAVRIGGRTVVGVTVECRGLSRAGGFRSFCLGMASLLE